MKYLRNRNAKSTQTETETETETEMEMEMEMENLGQVRRRWIEATFADFEGRRIAIIKALTDDVSKFREQCGKYVIRENEYLGLYGFPDKTWKVMLSVDVPLELPHSKLHKLPNSEKDKNKWLAKVAADSDTWLLTLTFTHFARFSDDNSGREWLFNKINELSTICEVVTCNDKNQEVATEKAKKRVKDKPTVSGHCKALSNSEVVQQGMSSSRLVKDLKRGRKKTITKRERPMRSAIQTRSKTLGIQTKAQTGKSQIKIMS